MKYTKAIVGLGALSVGVVLSTSVLASSSLQQGPNGLKNVAAQGAAPSGLAPAQVAAPNMPAKSWREALSSADFQERADAFQQAVSLVPHDATLRSALEEWAGNKQEGELAWTAYLILREAQDSQASPFPGSIFGGHDPFQGLLDGNDPFQDFFGGRDPFAGMFPNGQGLAPFGGQLQPGGAGTLQTQGQSFRLETTPDGVKVHVEKEGPNGTETNEYEAESLEELQALHPEIFQDGGLQIFSGAAPQAFGQSLLPKRQLGLAPMAPTAPNAPMLNNGSVRTDVLGVMVREVGAVADSASGLLVERVLPGTIAAAVGLERGDIVTRVAGAPVNSSADVKAALKDRDDDEGVVVEWTNPAGQTQTGTWAPEL